MLGNAYSAGMYPDEMQCLFHRLVHRHWTTASIAIHDYNAELMALLPDGDSNVSHCCLHVSSRLQPDEERHFVDYLSGTNNGTLCRVSLFNQNDSSPEDLRRLVAAAWHNPGITDMNLYLKSPFVGLGECLHSTTTGPSSTRRLRIETNDWSHLVDHVEVVSGLQNSTILRRLELVGNNGENNTVLQQALDSLATNTALEELHIDLEDPELNVSFHAMMTTTRLHRLELEGCIFSRESSATFFAALRNNQSIHILGLVRCHFHASVNGVKECLLHGNMHQVELDGCVIGNESDNTSTISMGRWVASILTEQRSSPLTKVTFRPHVGVGFPSPPDSTISDLLGALAASTTSAIHLGSIGGSKRQLKLPLQQQQQQQPELELKFRSGALQNDVEAVCRGLGHIQLAHLRLNFQNMPICRQRHIRPILAALKENASLTRFAVVLCEGKELDDPKSMASIDAVLQRNQQLPLMIDDNEHVALRSRLLLRSMPAPRMALNSFLRGALVLDPDHVP